MFCKITENYKYGVHLSFIVEKEERPRFFVVFP